MNSIDARMIPEPLSFVDYVRPVAARRVVLALGVATYARMSRSV